MWAEWAKSKRHTQSNTYKSLSLFSLWLYFSFSFLLFAFFLFFLSFSFSLQLAPVITHFLSLFLQHALTHRVTLSPTLVVTEKPKQDQSCHSANPYFVMICCHHQLGKKERIPDSSLSFYFLPSFLNNRTIIIITTTWATFTFSLPLDLGCNWFVLWVTFIFLFTAEHPQATSAQREQASKQLLH